jgi:hypothetical protein
MLRASLEAQQGQYSHLLAVSSLSQTRLAEEQYGFFSWMWMLNTITDDEILDHCGMDALCFLRTLSMGYRICLLGMLNGFWLMPLYATAADEESDVMYRITTSNVPAESPRFIGTVLAAYTLFGYTMYLILREFEWFIELRHKWLGKAKPRNYSYVYSMECSCFSAINRTLLLSHTSLFAMYRVYVRNIPPDFRTNAGLETFFRHCFSADAVLEARLRVTTAELQACVQKRDTCVANLENVFALEAKTGVAPTHTTTTGMMLVGEKRQVNSIEGRYNTKKSRFRTT